MKIKLTYITMFLIPTLLIAAPVLCEEDANVYKVGISDILHLAILQPDEMRIQLTVAPDGNITVPYIGTVRAKDHSLMAIQFEIQERLGSYLKYPVVSITLEESHSQQYYVYGEVSEPGTYPLQEGLTIIRAIAVGGSFTKYGSSNVKVLRQRPGGGNQVIKIDINKAMNGDDSQDITIKAGDVIIVSESAF